MPSPDEAMSSSDALSNATYSNGAGNEQVTAPSSIDRDDAMAENKEKARAVMAAGLKAGSNPPSRVASTSPADPSTPLDDASQSRKRSRSGSRKPADAQQPSLKELYLDQYTTRDQMAYSAMTAQDRKLQTLLEKLNAQKQAMQEFSMRTLDETRRNPPRLKYPNQRKRFADRKTRELRVSRQDRVQQADQLEELVPIRLDLEFEKLRLRDTFTWNIHDRTVPAEIFAQGLVEDFRIPPEASHQLTDQVFANIQEQMSDYHPHVWIEEEPLDPHLPYSAYKNDEMRIKIALNITIGQHTLVDNFDWDINNPHNDPEAFARKMALELSLSGEFMTAIAHSIREQCQLFTKALYVSNHQFDGRPIDDSDVQENMLATPLASSFRPFQQAKDFTPMFYELNDADLERQELVFSREQRQQKRSGNNRRGGPQMPALKDRLKTWRTMVVSSVIPGAAETVENSGLFRISRSSGKRKAWNRGDDSDVSESEEEDEGVDSPARVLQGTSRTRGMRGAASAAQVAMRQSLNTRSQTPEHLMHHHETRSVPRKFQGYEGREESVAESTTYIIKLKLPRQRYRDWWRSYKQIRAAREAAQAQQQAQQQEALRLAQEQAASAGAAQSPSIGASNSGVSYIPFLQRLVAPQNAWPGLLHSDSQVPPHLHLPTNFMYLAASNISPSPMPRSTRSLSGGMPGYLMDASPASLGGGFDLTKPMPFVGHRRPRQSMQSHQSPQSAQRARSSHEKRAGPGRRQNLARACRQHINYKEDEEEDEDEDEA